MQRTMMATMALLVGLMAGACGESPLNNVTGPSAELGMGSLASTAPDVQCSDATPTWKTQNFSTSRRSFLVDWFAVQSQGVTYEVVVTHNRNEGPVKEVSRFRTTRSNAQLGDPEDGGTYYIVVRVVHNPCGDVEGAFSRTLIVYLDGRADNGGGGPEEPPYEPPGDEDDNDNGHGNDDDGDDDSNPGNGGDGGNGGNGGGGPDDDHDNGHGNDDDDDDDSNPGQGGPHS